MMEKAELSDFRVSRGLNQAEFGRWLADQMGKERAYKNTEVSNWETGARDIPWAVQAIVWKTKYKEAIGTRPRLNEDWKEGVVIRPGDGERK